MFLRLHHPRHDAAFLTSVLARNGVDDANDWLETRGDNSDAIAKR